MTFCIRLNPNSPDLTLLIREMMTLQTPHCPCAGRGGAVGGARTARSAWGKVFLAAAAPAAVRFSHCGGVFSMFLPRVLRFQRHSGHSDSVSAERSTARTSRVSLKCFGDRPQTPHRPAGLQLSRQHRRSDNKIALSSDSVSVSD